MGRTFLPLILLSLISAAASAATSPVQGEVITSIKVCQPSELDVKARTVTLTKEKITFNLEMTPEAVESGLQKRREVSYPVVSVTSENSEGKEGKLVRYQVPEATYRADKTTMKVPAHYGFVTIYDDSISILGEIRAAKGCASQDSQAGKVSSL